MKNYLQIILTISLILIISGLFSSVAQTKSSPVTAAVTIVPLAGMVKEVGGDLVDVIIMIPPGYNPTTYAPTPHKISLLSRADIYFSVGVPVDIAVILPEIKTLNAKIKVVKLYEKVADIYPDREFAPGKRDPHIWLSPARVNLMVEQITSELIKLDPANKELYLSNCCDYQFRLTQLDQELQVLLKGLEKKSFLIYHPSLGYFADDYGLKMVSVEQNGKKASARRLMEIVEIAKKKKITAVFYQSEFDSRQARVVADEIGGEIVEISPLAANYIINLKNIGKLIKEFISQDE